LSDVVASPVVVTLPARATYLFVARTVTAGLAARTQLPFDSVEDLRIAVTEACARLIAADSDATEMRLELHPAGDSLTVRVSVDADGVEWPGVEGHTSTSWQLIEGLCDDARDELVAAQPATVLTMKARRA
jgi:serine/threonine-protein kinase RsbW